MQKLLAVNTALPYFSESPVDSIDSRNPMVGLLLANFQTQSDLLLAEKFWFNVRVTTMYPNYESKIPVPKNCLAIYPTCSPNSGNVSIRGDYLWDIKGATHLFNKPIEIEIVDRLDFEDLPEYAAQTVLYRSTAQIYLANFGMDNIYQSLQQSMQYARTMLMQEHLRNQKYVFNPRGKAKYASMLRNWS